MIELKGNFEMNTSEDSECLFTKEEALSVKTSTSFSEYFRLLSHAKHSKLSITLSKVSETQLTPLKTSNHFTKITDKSRDLSANELTANTGNALKACDASRVTRKRVSAPPKSVAPKKIRRTADVIADRSQDRSFSFGPPIEWSVGDTIVDHRQCLPKQENHSLNKKFEKQNEENESQLIERKQSGVDLSVFSRQVLKIKLDRMPLNVIQDMMGNKKSYDCVWPDCLVKRRTIDSIAEHYCYHVVDKSLTKPDEWFTCEWKKCGQRFNTVLARDYHYRRHKKKALNCVYCEKTFAKKREWKQHLAEHRNSAKKLVCHEKNCGKHFASLFFLASHQESYHKMFIN